ncbi:MAG TPA: type II secretion system protein, partial [Pyrinomonadaceae bacterium]|nr:type II secretion system protein [Pyrinomonadaceae bacterium]
MSPDGRRPANPMDAHATDTPAGDARERGYALVALLAVMTILMIVMTAAAPSMRQQARRELELEAI